MCFSYYVLLDILQRRRHCLSKAVQRSQSIPYTLRIGNSAVTRHVSGSSIEKLIVNKSVASQCRTKIKLESSKTLMLKKGILLAFCDVPIIKNQADPPRYYDARKRTRTRIQNQFSYYKVRFLYRTRSPVQPTGYHKL